MVAYQSAVVMVLTEVVDSDNEKPRRGKAREWIKRRRECGYFPNIFQELKLGDRMGFKDMFRMSVTDYEFLLSFFLFLLVFHMCVKGTPLYRACFFFTTTHDACTVKLRTE